MREGEYSVWFKTPTGTGTGQIKSAGGKVSGGDAYISYEGAYQLDGEQFEAVVNTKRHTDGPPTWFGVDEVTIRISGKSIGQTATGSGTVDQCPGLTLGVTLMWVGQEEPKRTVDYSLIELHPERLPSNFR